MERSENGLGDSCYILTHGLSKKVELFKSIGLNTPEPNNRFYADFKEGLEENIRQALPQDKIRSLHLSNLEARVWARAVRMNEAIRNTIIVGTTRDECLPERGLCLEINRLYDGSGKKIGFGPRPGNPSLSVQFENLARQVGDKFIILVEEGSATGSTVVNILERFRFWGVAVSAIVLGLSTKEAELRIRQSFDGPLVVLESIPEKITDWMPDHDFIPFIPNGGRVFGSYVGGEFYPVYTAEGAPLAFPYIRPFGNPKMWASLPTDSVDTFSRFCLTQTVELFGLIENLNGGMRLRVKDLMGTRPMANIPISLDGANFPRLETEVVGYLETVMCQLGR
jgi:hypothetical protein